MQDLFGLVSTGKPLVEYCERHKANLEREVRHWDSEEFLATPDREITDYLIATHSVACPVLRQDEATVTEPERWTCLPQAGLDQSHPLARSDDQAG